MNKIVIKFIFLGISLFFASSLITENCNVKLMLPIAKSSIEHKSNKGILSKQLSVKNVIIVYETHYDIGYSARVQQVIHYYRTSMIDHALANIDKDKLFVWTVPGWPMKEVLWDGQNRERKKKIEQAIREGRIVVHAFPFVMHVETSGLEDMVRGLNISSTIARKYGRILPISTKMEDVPGESWLIPTLLTQAGIKFYVMGGPEVNLKLGLPPFFWWEGPDGSRLLTLYKDGYSTDPLPPANWPYKTWIYVHMSFDNELPPTREDVAKDLEFYKTRGINAKIGTMDDFAKMILKENLSKLPVVRTDIGDTWIQGTMSMPEATKLFQNIKPSIGELDQLSTLETIWGIYRPSMRKLISDAYEQSLLYSEHTWGLANQHYLKVPYGKVWQELWEGGLPPQYKLMEDSWSDKANYVNNVKNLITNPLCNAIETLADNVNVDGNRVVVYNPLPWKRDGEIDLDTRLTFGNDFVSLKPVDGGSPILVSHEYPALDDKAPMSRFFVKNIPPMGYRTYIVSNEKVGSPKLIANKESGVIESPFFKATIDAKHGRISSLIDKRTGKELVDVNAPQGFGQYFYERFGFKQIHDWEAKSLYPQYLPHKFMFAAYDIPQDIAYRSALPEYMSLTVEKTALDVKAIMTGIINGPGQPQKVSMSLTLSGFNPTAELKVSWQKQPDTWPEAAWICLPFKCDNPQFRLGRLGAIVDPVKDMVVNNANYHLFWVNNGVAVYDSITGAGIGICSTDAPLVSLGEPGLYKFNKRYEPKKPYIYLNLYNNQWRTNFPSWVGNGQRMSAKVRIWTFDKFSPESSLYTPAMETRIPLLAACSTVKHGNLPNKQQGISLSRKGVAVTAFGPNPDGKGIILRVWEQGGTKGRLEVTLPTGTKFSIAQPVNLRGEKQGSPFEIKDCKFSFNLQAYAPASFILK
jgi:hypothetical protein